MFRAHLAAILGSLFLLGPLLAPHACDPYHAHLLLDRGPAVTAATPAWAALKQPAAREHPPGVDCLCTADPSGPLAIHAGGLLPVAAAVQLLTPPANGHRVRAALTPCYSPVHLDRETPPPRAA